MYSRVLVELQGQVRSNRLLALASHLLANFQSLSGLLYCRLNRNVDRTLASVSSQAERAKEV